MFEACALDQNPKGIVHKLEMVVVKTQDSFGFRQARRLGFFSALSMTVVLATSSRPLQLHPVKQFPGGN
jgi:hypothetical protein